MPDFRFINSRPVDLREVEKLVGTIQRRKTAKEVEKAAYEESQIAREKLNTQHPLIYKFTKLVNEKPLEPWQQHFLNFVTQELLECHPLKTVPPARGKVSGKFTVKLNPFYVMRDLTQSEFEKAVLLKPDISHEFLLLPFFNHYLDRAVFFAQLSQQTNNIVHLNKAYKRAHLVCMVIKYFLKDKHTNLAPSARLRTAIKKGLYA